MPRSLNNNAALTANITPSRLAIPRVHRHLKPRPIRTAIWDEIRSRMPGRAVLPDSPIFAGIPLGRLTAPPAAILPYLEKRCILANDGRTVAETHRLVYLPLRLGGEETSIVSLRAFAADHGGGALPLFATLPTLQRERFEIAPLQSSRWILAYADIAPHAATLSNGSRAISTYRTAQAIELAGVLILSALANAERLFPRIYGETSDHFASGDVVCIGNLYGARPIIRAQETAAIPQGRALVWSHDCALPFNDKR